MTVIAPFKIEVSDAQLADLMNRVDARRLPGEVAGSGWSQGPAESWIKAAIDRLRNGYDWRAEETRLNRLPQFRTEIDNQDIHFVHVRSEHPDATPLMLLHGWPGSFVEFVGVVDALTNPATGPAFHLVIPSLPGFAFSGPTHEAGWNDGRIADAMLTLMSRLGYERFGVQGGDAGAVIAPEIARRAPSCVVGVHVSAATMGFIPMGPIEPDEIETFTDAEKVRLQRMQRFMAEYFGFNAIQSSRPQALAYALTDSPVGLLAWISEMFTGFGETPDSVDIDSFLTNFLIYWFTGTAGSSIRLYYENAHDPAAWALKANSGVPTAVAVYATDVAIRRYGEQGNTIVRWTEFEKGGHFAALEVPVAFADDLRAFFAELRA